MGIVIHYLYKHKLKQVNKKGWGKKTQTQNQQQQAHTWKFSGLIQKSLGFCSESEWKKRGMHWFPDPSIIQPHKAGHWFPLKASPTSVQPVLSHWTLVLEARHHLTSVASWNCCANTISTHWHKSRYQFMLQNVTDLRTESSQGPLTASSLFACCSWVGRACKPKDQLLVLLTWFGNIYFLFMFGALSGQGLDASVCIHLDINHNPNWMPLVI